MNTKPFFLPSEVARLVLGYLVSEGFDQTSKRFLLECDCLEEFRKLKTMGLEYPTNILGLSLTEILDNFGFMKTQALERYNLAASTDCMWRDLDACLDKLKYRMLQTGSNKMNVGKIRTQRKFPDRNVKVLPENIGEMLLKQGKILSSKQIAQSIKKVHETMKENEDLKENHPENSGSSNHQSDNLLRQDLQRTPTIPAKDSSGIAVDEGSSVQIVDSPPNPLAENNEKDLNVKDDRHNNDGNREITLADNLDTSHNTESISGLSPSQTPNHHRTETADNLPTTPKQHHVENPTLCVSTIPCVSAHAGNTAPCVSTPKRQLLYLSELTKTSPVECEVTTMPQPVLSASSPSKVSDTGCQPELTESKPVYQSIGTQSDFPPVPSPPQPITPPNKPTLMETIPSTPTATSLKSLPLISESTPNAEHSLKINTIPSTDSGEPLDVSNGELDQSTDSLPMAAETTSLSFSSSPPSIFSGIPSSKTSHSVYKTPVKTVQSPYRTPGKENNQCETLNTPTRDKNNTLFSESLTPSKQSEADNAKSKRKRFPPEKRFVDISVPGPSQVRSESGNSQDSCSLKDPIPTFVEKVITETSLAKVLADTINRKLYGEAVNDVAAKSSENKNMEEGQKGECDKLMDEIMLTDFHMTKNDIDEVILETRSAGIPVLDDLLKLFASAVSEETDTLSGDECSEPVYDDVEFEELNSCSQSAENKEIKLITSGDDLSESDPKTSENPIELNSLNKSQTTFVQEVDKQYSSAVSTKPSSNQTSEDMSQKSLSTTLDDHVQNSENTAPEKPLASESLVKDIQTTENAKSSENSKLDPTSSKSKEVSITKQPSPCSRRTKVFSKGKSRKLVAAPFLISTNENLASMPPNTSTSMSSFAPIPSPSAKPSDTHSDMPQSNTTSHVSDTRPDTTNLTLESTNKTISTSSDIATSISSIQSSINTSLSTTSSSNLADNSSSNTLTITETAPTTISSELPAESTAVTTNASLSNTSTTSTMSSTFSISQVNSSSSLVQSTLSEQPGQPSKIITASISQNNSVVTRVIQPEVPKPVNKYPVMYIITPPNIPVQLQQTPTSFAPSNIPLISPSQTPSLQLQQNPTSFVTPNIPMQITPSQTTSLQLQPTSTSFVTPNIPMQFALSQTTTSQSNSSYTNVQWSLTDSASFSVGPQKKSSSVRGKTNKPRGRPKKGARQPPPPKKIYNIAPNNIFNYLRSTSIPVITEPVVPLQEKETLAVSTDNTWKIEMTPGTDNVLLNLKSSLTNEMVSYHLTAEQVKDHLASFIGTSAITDQILKWMKKLKNPKGRNRPNILTPKKTKTKIPVIKITPQKQIVVSESGGQTPAGGHQNNSPFTTPRSEEMFRESGGQTLVTGHGNSPPFTTPRSEEMFCESGGQTLVTGHGNSPPFTTPRSEDAPILYVAKPLGKIEEFFKRTRADIESPKQVLTISSPAPSQVIEITDSPTSSVFENVSPNNVNTSHCIGKSSPNLRLSLSKEDTLTEGDQVSPEVSGVQHLDLNKEVGASCSQNNSNNVGTTDPLNNENEFLAINILSTLCYSQSECCNKVDSSVVVSQPKETAGRSFCDVSAASPAKCYKILMEGEEKFLLNAQPVETPDCSTPVLQKDCRYKKLDLNDTIGYVSPALCKPKKETSEMKDSDIHSRYEDESLVSCKKKELETKGSRHRSDTKGSRHISEAKGSGFLSEMEGGGHILETKGGNGQKSEAKGICGQKSKTKVGSDQKSEAKVGSGQKSETEGSGAKKSFDKSPCFKTKKPTKRKLYDRDEPKNVKKINLTDIDLLLTRLHPDSLDGYD